MDQREECEFLDLLYSAAVEPALWVPTLKRFADMIGGTSGLLSRHNIVDGSASGVGTRYDPAVESIYNDYYADKNVLLKVADPGAFLRSWAPRILTDEDWMPKEAFVRSEYYNDFLRPMEIHSVLMIRLAAIDQEVCALNINRPEPRGQFDRPDIEIATRLHPHLIRAFNLSDKLADGAQLSEGAASVFDGSPHGLFLLDAEGRVKRVNPAGEALARAGAGVAIIGGRLSATAAEAANRLAALIGAAASRDTARRTGGSMALASPTLPTPLSVTVAPVRAGTAPLFASGRTVIVCVTDLGASIALSEQKLRDLFALTPAEAKVSAALFKDADPKKAAARLGISSRTLQVHLGHIFEKTGTNRQSELMRLMTRIACADLA
ncbi:hypothetical protein [Phenylobacterium sp.]|uniref:helix-turn-helix transcriptional regulator n=1 Tax=Phenylobacterium sp. TaxID=1871053 RepID=UPI00121F009B|nr:hypothetical protein [Phenylobacterium sp.]THD63454.1 MAG: hypothetical protein E8A49_05390 [Phenylobacterium sp.]